jgi:DNA mismatch repair protein MutS2
MENLVRELREKAKSNTDAQPSSDALAEMRNAIAEKERKIKAGLKIHASKPKQPLAKEELTIGKRVWVDKMNAHGVIESISSKGSNVTLSINGLQVTVKTSELEKNRDGMDKLPQETVVKIIRPRSTESLSSELNLIGMRSADAIDLLSEFIDRASLQRMPELRIVHGFGTGRLRLAIHEWLRTCPAVKDYHLGTEKEPGAGGCTIVHLNN